MKMLCRLLPLSALPLIAGIMGLSSQAGLAADAQVAEPPQRVIALVVYGDDPCPDEAGNSDEIVVCARKPEAERYRIPKTLREQPQPVGGPGWASQVANIDEAGRQAMMPNSCSPGGSAGFTGCTQAMLRQWYAERRMQNSNGVPKEQ